MNHTQVMIQSGVTTIKIMESRYTWVVENIDYLKKFKIAKLTSPLFVISQKDNCHGQLEVSYSSGSNWEQFNVVGYIVKGSLSSSAHTRFSVTGIETMQIFNPSYIFDKTATTFLYTNIRVSNQNSNNIDPVLTITCSIYVYVDTISYSNQVINSSSTFNQHDEFKQLLDDQTFSDITIIVADRKFPAHKAILAMRNPVFSAMLRADMKEKKQNEINITDIKPAIMEKVLQFIYTNEVSNVKQDMEIDLLAAADKYDLQKLKILCENKLMSRINTDNAIQFFHLAEHHQAKALEACALGFIKSHSQEMMQSENFKKDLESNSCLLAQLYLDLLSTKNV